MSISKKITLLSVVVASIICGSASAEVVRGGQVTFNGEVTSGSCAVSSTDSDKIVNLDTVRTAAFTSADQLANAKKPFTINLVECDTTTRESVQISFTGQMVEGKPGVLANTAGVGSAGNIGLQLFNTNGTALNVGTLSTAIDLTETTSIPLSVDYVSTGTAVTAGKVQSVADFKLTYN